MGQPLNLKYIVVGGQFAGCVQRQIGRNAQGCDLLRAQRVIQIIFACILGERRMCLVVNAGANLDYIIAVGNLLKWGIGR